MIIPFLFITAFTGAFSFCAKKRFEEVLPHALMSSAFFLYFSWMLTDNFTLGYYFCIAIAICAPVYLFAQIAFRKKDVFIFNAKLIFTPAFFIFCALFAVVFLLNWNKGFTMWDEFSHWGPMVRENVRLNTMYTSEFARSFAHPDYPPIVSLFETLWCKLSGGYNEAYLYRALQILSFSLFFPSLCNLKWKKTPWLFVKCAGILALFVTLPLCVELEDAGFYSTIYMDCFLALLLAYGVYLALTTKKWDIFELARLGIALSFLLLTKQMGMAFYALILACLIVNFAITNWKSKQNLKGAILNKQTLKKGAITSGFLVAMPVGLGLSWSLHVKTMAFSQQFSASNITSWKDVILSAQGLGTEPWKHEVLTSYIDSLLSYRIVVWQIHMPYWALVLLFCAFLLAIAFFARKFIAPLQTIMCTVIMLGGSIAYAFAMLVLYLTSFSYEECMRLASFPRYMGTYPFALIILCGMVFTFVVTSKKISWKSSIAPLVAVAFLWAFCMPAEQLKQITPTQSHTSTAQNLNEVVREIESRVPENASVLVVTQSDFMAKDPAFYNVMLQYRMADRGCGLKYISNEENTQNQLENLQILYNQYDYIYFCNITQSYNESFAQLLNMQTVSDKDICKVANGQFIIQ